MIIMVKELTNLDQIACPYQSSKKIAIIISSIIFVIDLILAIIFIFGFKKNNDDDNVTF